jgi:DNA-binding transcriptional ArsR family regulator
MAAKGVVPAVLRIQLEPSDLLAVRFETQPGPLHDVAVASRALRVRRGPLVREWRRAVLPRLSPGTAVPLMLNPPTGFSYDFTSPASRRLDEGLDAVLSTPKRILRYETEEFAVDHGAPPRALHGLPDGDLETLHLVSGGLRAMHETAVAPFEAQLRLIRDVVTARHAMVAAREGMGAMLNGLHPTMRLRGMVLEFDRPFEFFARSPGEGIVLIPTPWLHDEVRLAHSPFVPLRILFPAGLPLPGADAGTAADGSLARLLGATRARMLGVLAIADGPGTVALAAELRISAATASEHLSVLRQAGLIATSRGRHGASHRLTPMGEQLLATNL